MRISTVTDDASFFTLASVISKRLTRSFRSLLAGGQIFNIRTSDQWWQRSIDLLMHSSDIVVMDVSKVSKGSAWEIEQLGRRGLLDRAIFIVQNQYESEGRKSLDVLDNGASLALFGFDGFGFFAKPKDLDAALQARIRAAFGRELGVTAELAKAAAAKLRTDEDRALRGSLGRWAAGVAVFVVLLSGGWWGLEKLRFKMSLEDPTVAVFNPDALKGSIPTTKFQECRTCPLMEIIPRGEASALVGSDPSRPSRKIRVERAFAIGVFAVTFEEWDACAQAGACNHYWPEDEGWGRLKRPVINVSKYDADAYVTWLSAKTGQHYRLLSEVEWEYAARAGSSYKYPWGDAVGTNNANCHGCSDQYMRRTSPVGSFSPNAYGLYDMPGNVKEWVEATSEWPGILRGGSWYDDESLLDLTKNSPYGPNTRNPFSGFRVARTL